MGVVAMGAVTPETTPVRSEDPSHIASRSADRAYSAKSALLSLRIALAHEYAHFIVAFHYRVTATVLIWRNQSGDLTESDFLGTTILSGAFPTARSRRLIGLAGGISEILLDDPDVDEVEIIDWLQWNFLSETDREIAAGYSDSDVLGSLKLVRAYSERIMKFVDQYADPDLYDDGPVCFAASKNEGFRGRGSIGTQPGLRLNLGKHAVASVLLQS
jgi:hypothetical protein